MLIYLIARMILNLFTIVQMVTKKVKNERPCALDESFPFPTAIIKKNFFFSQKCEVFTKTSA